MWKFVDHSKVFKKKITQAGLKSLGQKGYQISVENLIFDGPFHKKGLFLIILVLGMIQSSGSVVFWWNEAVEVIEATKVVEAVEVIEAI